MKLAWRASRLDFDDMLLPAGGAVCGCVLCRRHAAVHLHLSPSLEAVGALLDAF